MGFVNTVEFFVMTGIEAASFFGSIVHRRYCDLRVDDAGVNVRLSRAFAAPKDMFSESV